MERTENVLSLAVVLVGMTRGLAMVLAGMNLNGFVWMTRPGIYITGNWLTSIHRTETTAGLHVLGELTALAQTRRKGMLNTLGL